MVRVIKSQPQELSRYKVVFIKSETWNIASLPTMSKGELYIAMFFQDPNEK